MALTLWGRSRVGSGERLCDDHITCDLRDGRTMAAARQYCKELHVSSEYVDRWEHNPRTTKRARSFVRGSRDQCYYCSRIHIQVMNKTTFFTFPPNAIDCGANTNLVGHVRQSRRAEVACPSAAKEPSYLSKASAALVT